MLWLLGMRLRAPLKPRSRCSSKCQARNRWANRFSYRATVESLEARIVLSLISPTVEVRQFDFNTAGSPNQPGWTSVQKGDLFNQTSGYGWETAVASDFYDSRAVGDDVIKDGHSGESGRFQIVVKAGSSYNVELIFRDKRSHEFEVALEGNPAVVVKTPKLTVVSRQFSNIVSGDNVLTIQFATPQPREEFIINGLKITGEPVILNTAPVASDDALTLDEDSQATINALANDIDSDGDPLVIASFRQPVSGSVSNIAGYFTYTPDRDFFGNDPFSYTISDGKGGTDTATVTVVVNGVNDSPVANNDIGPGFETAVDSIFTTANVLNNDTDPDSGDTLAVTRLDTNTTAGTVTANGNGTFIYAPPPGYVGTDAFGYTVSDSSGETATATVSITIRKNTTVSGIWIGADELMALPTSGLAWDTLLSAANSPANSPLISNQDDNTDVFTLAKALAGVRLGDQDLMSQARSNIMAAIGTEVGGRTLALGRNLASYVMAADLVGLSPQDDATFRAWLRETLTENLSGRTLQSTHEDRPNNWGTMAGASRAAVAVYLGDLAELERTALVFKGYLGDRTAYAEFNYGSDLSWQADPNNPVGINPKGAMKEGHSIDGVLPDDMRRGGSFTWPPIQTGYAWEGLQGALVQAEILHRAGYDSWQWQEKALLRSVEFLYGIGWDAEGDDEWQPWLINARYGANFAANPAARHGKIMGWTAWTHQSAGTTTGGMMEADQALLSNLQTAYSTPPDEQTATKFDKNPSLRPQRPVSLVAKLRGPVYLPALKNPAAPYTSQWMTDELNAHEVTPGHGPLLDAELDRIFANWPKPRDLATPTSTL